MVEALWQEQREKHKSELMNDRGKKVSQMAASVSGVFDTVLEKVWLWDVADDFMEDIWYSLLFDDDGKPKRWAGLFLEKKKLQTLTNETIDKTKGTLDDIKTDIYESYPAYKPYTSLIAQTVNIFAETEPSLPTQKWVHLLQKENAHPPAIDTPSWDDALLTWWKKTAIGQVFPDAFEDAKAYLEDNYDIELPLSIEELSLEQQLQVSAGYIHKFYKETGDRKEAVLRYHLWPWWKPPNDETAREWACDNQAIVDAYNDSHTPTVDNTSITADQYVDGAISYYELA